MDEDRILTELERTELCKKLKKMRDLYQQLEKDQERFCDRFCIHCKSGCGTCCEHFIPDITQLEAEYLAFGLIAEDRDESVLERLQNRDINSPFCPLYDQDNLEHHCTVYRWRPLICRLFGAAASEDKAGHPVFRNCKWNENTHPVTSEEMEKNQDDVVLMGRYGMMMEENEVSNTGTLLLPEALEKAVSKVRLMLMLEEESKRQ